MIARPFALALAALGLAAGGALAQHGWGSYDAAMKFTIASPVERLAWQNPHVQIFLGPGGATGKAVRAPPFRMEARGLSTDLIKAGTSVEVEGYPSTQHPHEQRGERIVVAGKTYELL